MMILVACVTRSAASVAAAEARILVSVHGLADPSSEMRSSTSGGTGDFSGPLLEKRETAATTK